MYEAVRRIAPGTVLTYGEVAEAIGRPGAARAVGNALAALAVGSGVPAHRVVAADGRLRCHDLEWQARRLRGEGVALVRRGNGEWAVDWRRAVD